MPPRRECLCPCVLLFLGAALLVEVRHARRVAEHRRGTAAIVLLDVAHDHGDRVTGDPIHEHSRHVDRRGTDRFGQITRAHPVIEALESLQHHVGHRGRGNVLTPALLGGAHDGTGERVVEHLTQIDLLQVRAPGGIFQLLQQTGERQIRVAHEVAEVDVRDVDRDELGLHV